MLGEMMFFNGFQLFELFTTFMAGYTGRRIRSCPKRGPGMWRNTTSSNTKTSRTSRGPSWLASWSSGVGIGNYVVASRARGSGLKGTHKGWTSPSPSPSPTIAFLESTTKPSYFKFTSWIIEDYFMGNGVEEFTAPDRPWATSCRLFDVSLTSMDDIFQIWNWPWTPRPPCLLCQNGAQVTSCLWIIHIWRLWFAVQRPLQSKPYSRHSPSFSGSKNLQNFLLQLPFSSSEEDCILQI